MNISPTMIPGTISKNKSDGDGQAEQNGRAEKFPERPRMPQQREVDGVGIVVRGKIERRRAHAEQRAEREIDQRADERRLLGRAGDRAIDAAC